MRKGKLKKPYLKLIRTTAEKPPRPLHAWFCVKASWATSSPGAWEVHLLVECEPGDYGENLDYVIVLAEDEESAKQAAHEGTNAEPAHT